MCNMYQHLKLTIMRGFLIMVVLLFSANLIGQQTKEEERSVTRNKAKEINTNVTPAYNKVSEPEMKEAPTGKLLEQTQSSVLFDASQNLQKTLNEIKQMSSQKTPTSKQVEKLNYELIKIKNVNENVFEYHLYNYKAGNYDFDRIDDLKAAARIQPNHPEVLKSLSAYHYILNNESDLKEQLIKMDAAKHFSSELTAFANDVLHTLPKNSILLTHGEDDTYPLLIEQYVNATRKDVKVISLEHLQSETYRDKLKRKGFKLPKSNIINTSYFEEFVSMNSENLIVSTSFPKTYLKTIRDDIRVEGLGFRVDKLKNENAQTQLVKLYENTIKSSLEKNKERGYDKLLSNYLPFLFELRNYWVEANQLQKVKEIEDQIIDIGRRTNKLDQILKMLK